MKWTTGNQASHSADGALRVLGRIHLASEDISLQTLLLVPKETAEHYRVIAFRQHQDEKSGQRVLSLASDAPTSDAIREFAHFLQEKNGITVALYRADRSEIESQLTRYPTENYKPKANTDEESAAGKKTDTASSEETDAADQSVQKLDHDVANDQDLIKIIESGVVPNMVAGLLNYAMVRKASDVHVEPLEDQVRVRVRIDGSLLPVITIPAYFRSALVSRIKILAQMRLDEQRVPQDGRFDFDFHRHAIDIRVSTFPTVYGEKVVMRLLDKDAGVMTLEQLGITGHSFDAVVKAINKPYGVILATGPTGSGKTTSLYAILNRIAHPNINVITLEDPVEYEMPGINQSQVKPAIGYSFAEGLRSVLRQDPNVIMVGEVRDLETATMVTHAALTGHLVLTTLHTNDAAGALPRLINIGVEPFLLTSAINAVIAQRLVRKLCVACRQQVQLPEALLDQIRSELAELKGHPISHEQNFVFYQAVGCGKCTSGYSGRIGIYEVLTMDDTIESLAVAKQPASVIAEAARKQGMITLKQDGILKALKGITTIDEVWRVTNET